MSPTVERNIMAFSPDPDTQNALLQRMRTLLNQLDDQHPHAPEYQRLSAEIHELS
jgi:hypothetical protein